jgi:hypothetical protein
MKKGLVMGMVLAGFFTVMACDAMAKVDKVTRINAVSRLAHAGDIYGNVGDCTTGTLEGVFVFIPGTSFTAVTDVNGDFTLYNVPKGVYDIRIDFDGDLTTIGDSTVIKDFNVLGKIRNLLVCNG